MNQYEFSDCDLHDIQTSLVEISVAELLSRREVMEEYCIDWSWINSLVFAGCERLSERLDHVEKKVLV